MAEETKPAEEPKKPGKVYKLRKQMKLCAKCQKPLTSDNDEVCAVCALAIAQEKAAKEAAGSLPEGTAKGDPEPTKPKRDPNAFSRTCSKCGAGCSSDQDDLCKKCQQEAKAYPEETTLDVMKQVLAEVERQNTEDDQIAKEVKERFAIRDRDSANWAAGKIAMWKNEIERRKAQAKEFIAEAERNERRLRFLFMAQLEAWAKANIPQDKKSIKLPLATLKFSDTQEKIEIVDDKKAVAWATVNLPDAVEMSPSLQMLKDHWIASETKDPATGEVKRALPDGCVVIPKATNFKVE